MTGLSNGLDELIVMAPWLNGGWMAAVTRTTFAVLRARSSSTCGAGLFMIVVALASYAALNPASTVGSELAMVLANPSYSPTTLLWNDDTPSTPRIVVRFTCAVAEFTKE